MHEALFGCVNAQERPVLRWQLAHAPSRCLAGRTWQDVHCADFFGWLKAQVTPGALWHEVHGLVYSCFATGCLWHDEHSAGF